MCYCRRPLASEITPKWSVRPRLWAFQVEYNLFYLSFSATFLPNDTGAGLSRTNSELFPLPAPTDTTADVNPWANPCGIRISSVWFGLYSHAPNHHGSGCGANQTPRPLLIVTGVLRRIQSDVHSPQAWRLPAPLLGRRQLFRFFNV